MDVFFATWLKTGRKKVSKYRKLANLGRLLPAETALVFPSHWFGGRQHGFKRDVILPRFDSYVSDGPDLDVRALLGNLDLASFIVEEETFDLEFCSATAPNSLRMYFKMWQCAGLRRKYCATTGTVYDLVIRVRPDVIPDFGVISAVVSEMEPDRWITTGHKTTGDYKSMQDTFWITAPVIHDTVVGHMFANAVISSSSGDASLWKGTHRGLYRAVEATGASVCAVKNTLKRGWKGSNSETEKQEKVFAAQCLTADLGAIDGKALGLSVEFISILRDISAFFDSVYAGTPNELCRTAALDCYRSMARHNLHERDRAALVIAFCVSRIIKTNAFWQMQSAGSGNLETDLMALLFSVVKACPDYRKLPAERTDVIIMRVLDRELKDSGSRFLLRAAERGCWLADGQPTISDLEEALLRLLDGGEVTELFDRGTVLAITEGRSGFQAMHFFRSRAPLQGAECFRTLSSLIGRGEQLPVWSARLYAKAGKAGEAAEMRALAKHRGRAEARADTEAVPSAR